jgi:hypothetical protein
MNEQTPKMRKAIIAGTYKQYRDWIRMMNAHQRAAPFVKDSQTLLDFDPTVDEVVLVGSYRENPAYQSAAYKWFVHENGRVSQVAA